MANHQLSPVAALQEEHWIPLSDLMTGLMMFFLLLAITYMVKVEADAVQLEAQARKIKDVAVLYDRLRTDLYVDLEKEFRNDLPKWGAELDRDLTVRFKEPEVLFDTGKDSLKPRFRAILDEFFPRYVRILTSAKYKGSVQEIRVEGHTSSVWRQGVSTEEAYFHNMALSQARTRSALQYLLTQEKVLEERPWLRRYLTANGLSSSKLVLNTAGEEDQARSQRVEFRVRTDADARIAKIIESTQQ